MGAEDDFYRGMQSEEDQMQQFADAATFYLSLRRGQEEPVEKKAFDLKHLGKATLNVASKIDPTGILRGVQSKPGAIAAAAGAVPAIVGTALLSRGKKELGGQSKFEHQLMEDKKKRDAAPEPKSFLGKMKNHGDDLTAAMASTARKHPVAASLLAGVGGAKAGLMIGRALTQRVK